MAKCTELKTLKQWHSAAQMGDEERAQKKILRTAEPLRTSERDEEMETKNEGKKINKTTRQIQNQRISDGANLQFRDILCHKTTPYKRELNVRKISLHRMQSKEKKENKRATERGREEEVITHFRLSLYSEYNFNVKRTMRIEQK